jgi:hypothetical protein
MKGPMTMHRIGSRTIAALAALAPWAASAHEGHGLPGASHWHASDVLGYLLLAAAVAAAVYFSRRK